VPPGQLGQIGVGDLAVAHDPAQGPPGERRVVRPELVVLAAREAVVEERARIARELHDDISQQVALLAIDLELLQRPAVPHAKDLSAAALTRTESIARSVHDLSHRLHPARLRLIGLVNALDGLRRELARPDLEIAFTHENVPQTLSPDLTLCVYRVVQEALQNAVKYSGARHVAVSMRGGPGSLTLSVADDGSGFEVNGAWGQGLGLISMRERVEAAGGTLSVRATPGSGTHLEISVPLDLALRSSVVEV
jgi:signal transduction histidine kinase